MKDLMGELLRQPAALVGVLGRSPRIGEAGIRVRHEYRKGRPQRLRLVTMAHLSQSSTLRSCQLTLAQLMTQPDQAIKSVLKGIRALSVSPAIREVPRLPYGHWVPSENAFC